MFSKDFSNRSHFGEGVEASYKSGPSRSSSNRCRAAEVHNLSEKTDKASMLDEAIEYLKQLQLQVQMLTMRNGINLHPVCLPGTTTSHPLQLSQSQPVVPHEATNDPLLNHTNQFASTPNATEMINSVASSYSLEPSIRSHFGPFPLLTPSTVRSYLGSTEEQSVFDGQQQPDIKNRLT